MSTCDSCKHEIEICEMCGGKKCSPGCPDRADDSCTCDMEADEGVEENA